MNETHDDSAEGPVPERPPPAGADGAARSADATRPGNGRAAPVALPVAGRAASGSAAPGAPARLRVGESGLDLKPSSRVPAPGPLEAGREAPQEAVIRIRCSRAAT